MRRSFALKKWLMNGAEPTVSLRLCMCRRGSPRPRCDFRTSNTLQRIQFLYVDTLLIQHRDDTKDLFDISGVLIFSPKRLYIFTGKTLFISEPGTLTVSMTLLDQSANKSLLSQTMYLQHNFCSLYACVLI